MSLSLEIKVVPGSGKQQWRIGKSGMLTCYLKNPPERGLANRELVAFVAQSLRIPRDQVTIVLGTRGRKKVLRIQGDMTLSDVLKALGLEVQHTFVESKKR